MTIISFGSCHLDWAGFAGLLVPLAGGLFWPQSTWKGALACIIVGTATRLVFFIMMPTVFGIDNTLLYIKNPIFTADFDGFPTLMELINQQNQYQMLTITKYLFVVLSKQKRLQKQL